MAPDTALRPVVNVLFCNHLASERLVAGAEFVLLTIAGNVDRRRFRPFFLSNREGRVNGLARAAGIETRLLPYHLFGGFLFPNRKTGRLLARFSAAQEEEIRGIAALIQDQKIGLVVANSIVNAAPLLAARRAGVPAVWLIHEILYPFPCIENPLRRAIAKALFPLRTLLRRRRTEEISEGLLPLADRTVVLSEKARERLASPREHRERLVTLNPPLRPEIFAAASQEEPRFLEAEEELVVAYLGVLSRHKGIRDFLSAAALVAKETPRVRFILAGGAMDARYEASLRQRVRRLRLENLVTFTGFLEDPTPVYRQAHVVCLVSLYDEPFGMVVTEAMAFGKTVVSYETGSIGEILEEGETGFIVPKGDPAALARRILALAKDRALLERIGVNARRRALARYNPSHYVRRIERVMEEALSHG